MAEEAIKGTVQAIIFPRNKQVSDFHVIALKSKAGEDIVAGPMFGIRVGDKLSVWGERVKHPKHGWQIKLNRYEKALPATRHAIIDYLSCGLVKGVGPATAKKLVDAFGESTLDIAIKQPEKLATVKGISPAKAKTISESVVNTIACQKVISFLSQLGVTPNLAVKAFKKWGGATIDKINANPYCLTDLRMVGFTQADGIAKALGISPASEFRVKAGILHTLRESAALSGHCYLPAEELQKAVLTLLDSGEVGPGNVTGAVSSLAAEGRVVCADGCIQLYEHARDESIVFVKTSSMMRPVSWPKGLEAALSAYEAASKIKLHPLQKQAVRDFFSHKIFILTGGPGTGKTQTIRAIADIAEMLRPGSDIQLAAPTGRASRRMAEVTGRHAVTAHRLLGLRGEEDDQVQRTINADVLIIDEFSMVDLPLAGKLFAALAPDVRLLIVGDTDQLPSVGPGNVLKDLIRLGVPHVRLTEVFRQAAESQIIANAHKINSGDPSLLTGKDFFFCQREEPVQIQEALLSLVSQYIQKHGTIEGLQVLSPMKKGPVGVEELNKEIQALANPPSPDKAEIKKHVTFREGDRVIHLVNNYDKEVFNGDVGTIVSIAPDDDGELILTVRYPATEAEYLASDLDELTLAYAITIHKSQGSEYPAVLMPLTTSHYIMLARNLVYTAVTRATQKACIVGTRKAHAIAVKNNAVQMRYTRLGGSPQPKNLSDVPQ
jgi:exodeoxyribonuclease V alpha subunit